MKKQNEDVFFVSELSLPFQAISIFQTWPLFHLIQYGEFTHWVNSAIG